MVAMLAPIVLETLSYLPVALKAGVQIADIAKQAISGNTMPPRNEVERFAESLLAQVPDLIAAGVDVYSILARAQQQVAAMQAEQRGPTPDEWAQLDNDVAALLKSINTKAQQNATE